MVGIDQIVLTDLPDHPLLQTPVRLIDPEQAGSRYTQTGTVVTVQKRTFQNQESEILGVQFGTRPSDVLYVSRSAVRPIAEEADQLAPAPFRVDYQRLQTHVRTLRC